MNESRKTNTNSYSCKSSVLACSVIVSLSFILTIFAFSFTSQLSRRSSFFTQKNHFLFNVASDNITTNSSFSFPPPAAVLVEQNSSVVLLIHSNITDPSSSLKSKQDDDEEKKGKRSTPSVTSFKQRVKGFLNNKSCDSRFFMTWITPSSLFSERESLTIQTLFKAHPDGCLVILSDSMSTPSGHKLLKPITDLGYRILSIPPDFTSLFKNTPALEWYKGIKRGSIKPGRIPIAQNLSNLLRLVALYKYGGIYLDTDFIVLRNFSGIRNAIGAQSVDSKGKWMRLNNAVLIFEKGHPVLLNFIQEFVATFDGNIWGHNGPYMVSRVMEKLEHNGGGVTVLPPQAFYPVDWIKIPSFFNSPKDKDHRRWIDIKIAQLNDKTYAVHLWNTQTRKLKIQEGSIIGRLVSQRCSICKYAFTYS